MIKEDENVLVDCLVDLNIYSIAEFFIALFGSNYKFTTADETREILCVPPLRWETVNVRYNGNRASPTRIGAST